jgi:SAM-dependent methyltransferase
MHPDRPTRQNMAVTPTVVPSTVAARARRERDLHLRVLQRRGVAPGPAARVLDFGCGNGASVHAYLEAGFDAWGCDIVAPEDDLGARLRTIRSSPYRLPFGDGEFDLVYSEQVFEHVMNPDEAIRELSRVLRPHGVGLHFFPSRYRPVECHVLVPFAGKFRPRWWLALWAKVGVRNEFQRGLDARDTVRRNERFLHDETNYLGRDALEFAFGRWFQQVAFVEADMLASTEGRARLLAPVARLAALPYSECHMRAILTVTPRIGSAPDQR